MFGAAGPLDNIINAAKDFFSKEIFNISGISIKGLYLVIAGAVVLLLLIIALSGGKKKKQKKQLKKQQKRDAKAAKKGGKQAEAPAAEAPVLAMSEPTPATYSAPVESAPVAPVVESEPITAPTDFGVATDEPVDFGFSGFDSEPEEAIAPVADYTAEPVVSFAEEEPVQTFEQPVEQPTTYAQSPAALYQAQHEDAYFADEDENAPVVHAYVPDEEPVSAPVDAEPIAAEDTEEPKPTVRVIPKKERKPAAAKVAPQKTAPKKAETVEAEPIQKPANPPAKATPAAKAKKPAKPVEETKPVETVAPVEEEPKPAKKPAAKKAAKPEAKPEAKPAEKPAKTKKVSYGKDGKFVISNYDEDTYYFTLYANNGQKLFESRPYTSIQSCKNAVETFKKNIAAAPALPVKQDKNGNYSWRFVKGQTVLEGIGYDSKASAESNAQSVKKFAETAAIAVNVEY